MSISAHHFRTLPTAQFLERVQRGSVLHVPAGPGVPQIVPAKIADVGTFQSAYQALVLTWMIELPL